jgi:glycosyltransferase involved in cell wall biosynthesis
MVSEHASPLAVVGAVDAGGQNVHVAALATALAAQGHAVTVHTRRDDATLPPQVLLASGVTVDHVPAGPASVISKDDLLPYMDEFADGLRARWSNELPDIVHAHFWMSGRAALRAADPLDVPVVQTFHALGAVKRRYQGVRDTSPGERLAAERAIIARVDHIIATCRDEVCELTRLGGDVGRMTVVPCGVDLTSFNPVGPRAARKSGWHRLLTVGRLVERKGIADIVVALTALPRTELLVAGGPPAEALGDDAEAQRLLSLAAELGVAGRVRLLGRQERAAVPALLRSADVVVATPWYEPFGMVALEAMACGVPVVASAVGGFVDSVVDGVTGVLVPPKDPTRLAETIRELLDDPARRATLGEAGVQRAQRRYGWPRIAAATAHVYRRQTTPGSRRAMSGQAAR